MLYSLHRVVSFHEIRRVLAFDTNGTKECIILRDIDKVLIVDVDELLRLYIRVEYVPDFWIRVHILRATSSDD